MTVWSTTRSPQILRRLLACFLGLAEHTVRVVTQAIGGGFGPKGILYPRTSSFGSSRGGSIVR
jgi:carbon-monoxide dehydrogenase large subunit